jgi:hypothetical protein
MALGNVGSARGPRAAVWDGHCRYPQMPARLAIHESQERALARERQATTKKQRLQQAEICPVVRNKGKAVRSNHAQQQLKLNSNKNPTTNTQNWLLLQWELSGNVRGM